MGSLKRIKGKRYETEVVSVTRSKANKIKKGLKEKHGNKISVRVQRTPKDQKLKHIKHQQFDVWRTPRPRRRY